MKRTKFSAGYLKPEDFYTRPQSDLGVKFPIEAPDGTQSSEWITVVGAESSLYEKAYRETMKATLTGSDSIEQSDILLSNLVINWSFNTDCTNETVLKFLQNTPYIKAALDKFVVNRANFLKKK